MGGICEKALEGKMDVLSSSRDINRKSILIDDFKGFAADGALNAVYIFKGDNSI